MAMKNGPAGSKSALKSVPAVSRLLDTRAGRLTPAEAALPVYLRDRVTHRR